MIQGARSRPLPGRPALALVLLIALGGVALGLAMCAAGLGLARDHATLLLRAEETPAVVERRTIQQAVGRGGGWNHVVGYRFSVEGRAIEGEAVVGEDLFNTLVEGMSLPVLYAPGDPVNHILRSEWRPGLWLGLPLTTLIFGLAVLGASGYAVVGTARLLFGGRLRG